MRSLVLVFSSVQGALIKEKSDRARIVLSLRETIGDLKQSGNQEGKLKLDNFLLRNKLTQALAAKVET